jgi:hypothetical protein
VYLLPFNFSIRIESQLYKICGTAQLAKGDNATYLFIILKKELLAFNTALFATVK